jgi:hypothetical protein
MRKLWQKIAGNINIAAKYMGGSVQNAVRV